MHACTSRGKTTRTIKRRLLRYDIHLKMPNRVFLTSRILIYDLAKEYMVNELRWMLLWSMQAKPTRDTWCI